MDARTNIATCLPGRHRADASAFGSVEKPKLLKEPELFKTSKPFKKPLYIPDSKPSGRHVAKDIAKMGGIPLLMTTLRGRDRPDGDGATVLGPAVAANLNPVNWNSHADV